MNIRISERKEKDHTLRHLRIFVTVCETGSMTAAAQILYIAQPAISLAVSEMEEHYKVRLFDRISRRFVSHRQRAAGPGICQTYYRAF